MAASAAKFAHCQPRYPVDYRSRGLYRPSIVAPLDFAHRYAEVVQLDRELDRTLLDPRALARALAEEFARPRPRRASAAADRATGGRPSLSFADLPERSGSAAGPLLRSALRFHAESNRFAPPWTVAMVQEAHAQLLAGFEAGEARGRFRRDRCVLADTDGETLLEHCAPERIGAELHGLVAWVDREGPAYVPLVPAGVLLQGFFAIRPFDHGNMFVARALAGLYLRQGGLEHAAWVPWNRVEMEDMALLQRLLLWSEASGSMTELIDHLADSAVAAYALAVRRFVSEATPAHTLDETGLRLVVQARRLGGWFSAQEAAGWVGGRAELTVLRRLNGLVRRGVLESLGRTRAKRFRATTVTPGTSPPARDLPGRSRRVPPARDRPRSDGRRLGAAVEKH